MIIASRCYTDVSQFSVVSSSPPPPPHRWNNRASFIIIDTHVSKRILCYSQQHATSSPPIHAHSITKRSSINSSPAKAVIIRYRIEHLFLGVNLTVNRESSNIGLTRNIFRLIFCPICEIVPVVKWKITRPRNIHDF